jgi:hypothetical protein
MQVKVADGVTMPDAAAAEIARWMVSAGRHSHQSILPWLWEVLSEEDMAYAPREDTACALLCHGFHCLLWYSLRVQLRPGRK